MKMTTLKLLAAALAVAGFAATASAQTAYYAATAQDLQSDLTLVATTGSDPKGYIIYLENDPTKEGGYFKGNFNYNSANGLSLMIESTATDPNNPNVSNPTNVIDGEGTGRGLNITSSGSVIVGDITFVRSCGNYQIGALRIAAGSGSSIDVNQCQFLSPGTNSGMGLEIASGQTATIESCVFIGKTNSTLGTAAYDSHGISISGIAGTTLIEQCTMSGNYGGYGAYVTAGQFLTVSNNVFQTNSSGGLYFDPSTGSELAGLSVSNNVFYGNRGSYAAYLVNMNTLIFQNNLMEGNSASYAILAESLVTATIGGNTIIGNSGLTYVIPGTCNLLGNTFSGNTGSYGGGYFQANQLTVAGNTFSGNSGSSYGGAGFYNNNGTLIVSNNTFTANRVTSDGGGGAYIEDGAGDVHGTAIVTGNTFLGNVSSGNYAGGALVVSDYCTNLITGNTFKNNTSADGGGAVYAATAGNTVFADNLVVSNIQSGAAATGGGILVNATTNFYMINNTIFGNFSAGGGGGAAFQTGALTILNVFNNIIYGNSCAGNGPDVYLSGTSAQTYFEYNDVDSGNDMYGGPWVYTGNLFTGDPKFFDPVNGDYHIQALAFPPSPCAGVGSVSAPQLPATDLDGNPRVNTVGQVDLGCYEFNNGAQHPVDSSYFIVYNNVFTLYSNDWQQGLAWNYPPSDAPNPNPIPANYVTRAGYLLMIGSGGVSGQSGIYYNDGSDRPTNWKPATEILSLADGLPGGAVSVQVSGFPASVTVDLYYFSGDIRPARNAWNAQAETGLNGSATFNNFTIPNSPAFPAGPNTILVAEDTAPSTYSTAVFNQLPLVGLNPTTGPTGKSVNITASVFAPNEPVTVRYNGVIVTTTPTSTANSSGMFNSNFTVPTGNSAGPYYVTVTGGINGLVGTAQFTQQ